jgi:energy-coupling factor transporter ATP-binding protein EcfA2
MPDFLMISARSAKSGVTEIYPKFIIKKSSDLMIRGGDFYAVWLEERGLWSTDEQDALQLIDRELNKYAEENRQRFDSNIRVLHMWDAESGMVDAWHKYCQRQMRDSFHMLDEKIIFSNTCTKKEDYASKKLSYPLEAGDLSAYDRLMSVLYSEKERRKIEWAIGSIISGESRKLQKFMVLYGAPGSGKSTVLNIIQQLFEGYYTVFDAKSIGSSNNSFALEAFRSNPLVAIQHEGDLSKIEDNTRLNSLVSHELMTVNEKFKSAYSNRFKCFLFMGTNKPVKITDAKSGLIRRLIDVAPTGDKLNAKEYEALVRQAGFELGAIAHNCQKIYLDNPNIYDNYIPIYMLGASNDFYNFVIDSWHIFKKEDGTTLTVAWEMYKTYCDNDVIATEAVFNARKADFTARQILANIAGMTVNDTTNMLITRIIFGHERRTSRKRARLSLCWKSRPVLSN